MSLIPNTLLFIISMFFKIEATQRDYIIFLENTFLIHLGQLITIIVCILINKIRQSNYYFQLLFENVEITEKFETKLIIRFPFFNT